MVNPYEESRKQFIECFLKYSECIKKGEKSFNDCVKDKKEKFPTECENERSNLYDKRRMLIDNRNRLRERN
jgi:hypothetical protein